MEMTTRALLMAGLAVCLVAMVSGRRLPGNHHGNHRRGSRHHSRHEHHSSHHVESVTDRQNPCNPSEFWCHNASPSELQCVRNDTDRCDGMNDCAHGEDEHNCPHFCRSGEFWCHESGKSDCVASTDLCDDFDDCPNNEDEMHCSAARVSRVQDFQSDGSGAGSHCPRHESPCGHGSDQCYPVDWGCDGENDCPCPEGQESCVATDEQNCPAN